MSKYCENCNYNCCRGGIWLCPGEEKKLDRTVRIYSSYFIDTFVKVKDGNYIRLINKFVCPYFCYSRTKKCSIYKKRPFICRIIPIDITINNNNAYIWVLRKYCPLYRQNKETLPNILSILKQMTMEINKYIDEEFLLNLKGIYDICTINNSSIAKDYLFINEIKKVVKHE